MGNVLHNGESNYKIKLIRKRIMAIVMSVAMIFQVTGIAPVNNVKTAKAAGITIRGGSIYRSGGNNATAYIYGSDVADVYYKISTSSTAPSASDIISEGVKAAKKTTADAVTDIALNSGGIASGSLYAHIAARAEDETLSNVVSLAMPSDRYVSEDFETYSEGATSGTAFFVLDANHKVRTVAGSRRYSLTGAVNATRRGISEGTRIHILEGTIRFDSDSPSAKFGICRDGNVNYSMAGVEISAGTWKSYVENYEPITLTKAGTAVKDTDYRVRIVYDYCGEDSVSGESSKPVYDIYINDVKMNDEPLTASTRWYSGPFMTSSAGQTTYYDDIKYYLPSNDSYRSTLVKYAPVTATYTKAQSVELTTSMTGYDIYYTTDGSYPTLDISPSSATKKYTVPFTIETSNTPVTVRAMIVKEGKAESIAYSETYTFVGAPAIKGNSVNRKNIGNAEVRFYSDTEGTAYYLTSNDKITPTADDIISEGVNTGVKAPEGDVAVIPLSQDMNARTRYAYVVIEDKDGTRSNVLEFGMPYERYFYDDFEAYPARAIKAGDAFKAGTYTDVRFENITDSMVLSGKGASYNNSLVQYLCNNENITEGKAVIEGRLRSGTDNPTVYFGFGIWYKASLYIKNGVWKACGYNNQGVQALDIAEDFKKDTWYDIRIELDIAAGLYDIYVNDVKANTQALQVYYYNNNANYKYNQEILFTPMGDTTAYLDDVRFYIEEKEIIKADEPIAVKGLEYTGSTQKGVTYDDESAAYTISGDTQASDVGTYTAVATLNTGYRWADGTVTPKNIIWAIAPKDITMTATVTDVIYSGNDPTACAIKADADLAGVVEAEAEYITLSDDSLADVDGIFTDIYAGTGKNVETADDYKFSIVTTDEDKAKISNYRLVQPKLTGNITAAAQSLTTRKSIPASIGQTVSNDILKSAAASSLDGIGVSPAISFEVVEGSDNASYSSDTGLVIKDSAAGSVIVIKAAAAAVDINGDGIPEYAADTDGCRINVIIKDIPKTSQTLSFEKELVNVVYGSGYTGQTAINDKNDGGAVTYKSSNESVAVVDKDTGAVTIISSGSAVISALAEATAAYNSDTASYVLVIDKAVQSTPSISYSDETDKGKDGTIEGLTTAMEYKKSGDDNYTKITGEMLKEGALTGLSPGVYYVRYSAGNDYKASDSVVVIISEYEPEPTDPPVVIPTKMPTAEPTKTPTEEPTMTPSPTPTVEPTATPTPVPTVAPTPTAVPTTEPAPTSTPFTEYEYIPVTRKDTVIKKTNTDKKDVEGSKVKFLQLQGTPGKNTITLKWKKISIADGYIIYGSKCGTKMAKLTELTNNSITKWKAAKLNKGKYYKYMVVAYRNTEDGKQVITSSKTVHIVTDGGKQGNPVKLKISKKNISVKVRRTAIIKADVQSKKKVPVHVEKLRYESDNTDVAIVSDDGTIMGVKKGKTTLYVYTQNGICGKIKVTVKN